MILYYKVVFEIIECSLLYNNNVYTVVFCSLYNTALLNRGDFACQKKLLRFLMNQLVIYVSEWAYHKFGASISARWKILNLSFPLLQTNIHLQLLYLRNNNWIWQPNN